MTAATVLLAADHRARGVITVERYPDYLDACRRAMGSCDGVLATRQPLADLMAAFPDRRSYLSLNRTGLAGAAFELDDRLVASVEQAAELGCTGVKHMTRIDLADAATAGALELLGTVIEKARRAGLEALIEAVSWTDGRMDRTTDGIVYAAVIAHDMGAPLLKVPVPADAPPGEARVAAVRRIVESVSVPVLFLGGPRTGDRGTLLAELADAMAGGGAGVAIGRAVYQDPDPGGMAELVSALVRGERHLDEVLDTATTLTR